MMILLSRLLVASAFLGLAACDNSNTDPARSQLEANLQLELGKTGQADGLTITFEAITEDSRCPQGVECVWAGEAYVRLVVEGTPDSLLVATAELAPTALIRRGSMTVRAIELAPYPGSQADERGDTPVVSLVTEEVAE